jgi:MFS family permease
VRNLLRDRNFRLLLAGQTLTMFGDVALFLALAIWVKDLTGSNGAAGAVFFAIALPALVAPFAGVYIDRFSRRKVMLFNDLAIGVLVLALFFVRSEADVWIIYAVALVYGGSQQIFFAARSGLLVTMLTAGDLGYANSLLESIRQGLRVIGPLFGAAIFAAFGGGVIAAIDSATFFASAAFLAAMTVPEHFSSAGRPAFREELTAGWRHIRRTPSLRVVIVVISIALAAIGLLETALFALVDEGLDRPAEFVGVIATIQGVGSIIGGLIAGPALRRIDEVNLLGITIGLAGIGLGLLVVASLPVVAIGTLIVGIAIAAHLVTYMTLMQRRTPLHLQGRVFSAAEAVLTAPFALSMATGVILISFIDYRLIYALNGLVLLAVGYYLWRWRDPDAPPATAPAAPTEAVAPP